ncbi:AIM24 family protein, partial [Xanthomonas arboricola]
TAASGPVFTDPNATVAWSGTLSPELVTDVSIGTLFGRGSGESLQMRFAGEGWVVVQPYEEASFQAKG